MDINRQEILAGLARHEVFDLLIIGGGATGCGIAVDAASRGLKVALAEKFDFAEGTSSRSTKLVHGGVRYLEMAVKNVDRAQYHLVREALYERGVFLRNAPHLAHRVPLVTPIYRWHEVPYVYAGLKLYDLLSGSQGIGASQLVGRRETLRRFPMLKADGLKAGVIYYDGQFNDARMAATLSLTALECGALVANHLEVVALEKNEGRLCGARLRDALGGAEFSLAARGVINATGPFVDRLRQMDEPSARPMLKASSGIHVILSSRFVPPETGMLIPKTEDGRVLFILPWQGHALVGTTEAPSAIVDHPAAQEEEIQYVLRHVNQYFGVTVGREDVKSAWSGLRPLVQVENVANTAKLVREHVIQLSPSGLLTMAGGKWTSYRRMAQEAVDQAIAAYGLKPVSACQTEKRPLAGAERFNPANERVLIQQHGLAADVAHHLHHAYGDRAVEVAALATSGFGSRLHPEHPVIEAEVIHSVRRELAMRVMDVLARRTSLAFLDIEAARAALPRVVELMASELAWDPARCAEESARARQRLDSGI